MNEELVVKIFEMISTAGTARAKFIEAIRAAKDENFEEAQNLITEGGECFVVAHKVHAEMIASEADAIESTGDKSYVSLLLVHAEDQMMSAESFRLISEEFINVYKKMSEK
jgi:cellobiose PTS system EIIA component